MTDDERVKLIEEAIELHDQGERNLLLCGERLLRIRDSLKQKHGQWTAWIKEYSRWSHQYANRLIARYQASLRETEIAGSVCGRPTKGDGDDCKKDHEGKRRDQILKELHHASAALDAAARRLEAMELDLEEARSDLANMPNLTADEAETIRRALKGAARALFDSKWAPAAPAPVAQPEEVAA